MVLGEVTNVDKDKKCIFVSDDRLNVPVTYDFLIPLRAPVTVTSAGTF